MVDYQMTFGGLTHSRIEAITSAEVRCWSDTL